MAQFLQAAKGAIEAASKSPLGLAAFLVLLATWLVVALKVNRNKQLLNNLSQLPEKDRLKALQAEMGTVRLKGGLTAEQWLKDRARTYYLIGLGMLCLTAVLLITIILNSHATALKTGIQGSLYSGPSADVEAPTQTAVSTQVNASDPMPSPSQSSKPAGNPRHSLLRVVSVTNKFDNTFAGEEIPPERSVTYESILQNGIPNIRFKAPYFDQIAAGGPIIGMNYIGSPFEWRYPELSFTVQNNTAQVMVLSQARVTVISSSIDTSPVPLVEDMSVNRLVLRNEGWGPLIDPVVQFSVSEPLDSGDVSLFAQQQNTVKLDSIDTVKDIPSNRSQEDSQLNGGCRSSDVA